MIGDEFKTALLHLLEHLDGCIAWKDPAQAERQKERLRAKREEQRAQAQQEQGQTDAAVNALEIRENIEDMQEDEAVGETVHGLVLSM